MRILSRAALVAAVLAVGLPGAVATAAPQQEQFPVTARDGWWDSGNDDDGGGLLDIHIFDFAGHDGW